MLMDAIRWNMLNVIRVELFFNAYRVWNIFVTSSLQSPRGQYAIISLIISLLAQFTVQLNLSWLLSIYSIYLAIGMCFWLHRRVYFYHRRLDSSGVLQTINHFELNKNNSAATGGDSGTGGSASATNNSTGTLKHNKHSNGGSSSSSSSSSAASGPTIDTNSLQRQRVSAYRDFQSVLNEPRRNHREFALSLAHLSNISKLVADKDVLDEMHFQILATRRDVVNIILRMLLFTAAIFLAYFD